MRYIDPIFSDTNIKNIINHLIDAESKKIVNFQYSAWCQNETSSGCEISRLKSFMEKFAWHSVGLWQPTGDLLRCFDGSNESFCVMCLSPTVDNQICW